MNHYTHRRRVCLDSGWQILNIEIFTRHLLGFNSARGYPGILRFTSCVNAAWWPNPCQERSPLYVFSSSYFHWPTSQFSLVFQRMSAWKNAESLTTSDIWPFSLQAKMAGWLSIARFYYQRVGNPWSHPFEPQTVRPQNDCSRRPNTK